MNKQRCLPVRAPCLCRRQCSAEADWRTFRPHGLSAFAAPRNIDAGGGNIERTLSDDDVSAECGALAGLIERTLVGLNLNRLPAVALKRQKRGRRKNAIKTNSLHIFCIINRGFHFR